LANFDISISKFIVGIVQASLLLFAFTKFFKRSLKVNSKVDIYILLFMLLHFFIQPWGSPNIGALMRLTLFEVVFFSCLILQIAFDRYLGEKLYFSNRRQDSI
jgi:hypothetical protein